MIYLTDRCCGIICHVWEGWRWHHLPSCSLCSVLLCYRYKSVAICGLTCMLCVFLLVGEDSKHFWLECCCLCIVLPLYLQPPAASWWDSSAFFEGTVSLLCPFCFFSFVMRTLHALPILGWRFWEFVALSVGEIFVAASSSLWHHTWPEMIGSDGWIDELTTLHESVK